jgi:hypothetical protein
MSTHSVLSDDVDLLLNLSEGDRYVYRLSIACHQKLLFEQ